MPLIFTGCKKKDAQVSFAKTPVKAETSIDNSLTINKKYTNNVNAHAKNGTKKTNYLNVVKRKAYYLNLVNKKANAPKPLKIKTYDGYNQPMHPDVLYINNGFHGFKYWMAYTSYPYSMGSYENPCIAASNDGINWAAPKGLKNPIVLPPSDVNKGGHYSDTDIVYDNGNLVVYFVYNKIKVLGPSKFYRSISKNGINWTKPELIYQCNNPVSGYSPAVIRDEAAYKMWYISEGNIMSYVTSKDSKNWSLPVRCNISIPGWVIWHLDVIKTNIGYEGLLVALDKEAGNRALFYIDSSNGLKWYSSALPVIYPSLNGWDSADIYRSTFLKQNGLYRIWYSARGQNQKWNIGYTKGKSMSTLEG